MPDAADLANDHAEKDLANALRARAPELRFRAACYNCDEPLNIGVFCDADCRLDWEKRSRSSNINIDP